MMKLTLHEMRNSWRRNLWLFLELLIAGAFLWQVLHPLCAYMANRLLPSGYTSEGVYTLNLDLYDAQSGYLYQQDQDNDERRSSQYHHILQVLAACPEVEAVAVGSNSCFPMARGMDLNQITANDTTEIDLQIYIYWALEGNQPERVLGLRDALTGSPLQLSKTFWEGGQEIALSASAAQQAFGTLDAVGKTVTFYPHPLRVAAVFEDVKHNATSQPYPLALITEPLQVSGYITWQTILFRLKPGVDEEAFQRRFEKEVVPVINQGNFAYRGMQSLDEYNRNYQMSMGVTGRLRLYTALVAFVLTCIFLGVFGTFWMHAQSRRSEIGLKRSMGASRSCIYRQFLLEAATLVTVAFLLVLLLMFHFAHTQQLPIFTDFTPIIDEEAPLNPTYWQNRPLARFAVVSAITYVLLLLFSTLAVALPVFRALRQTPADALHEEE